MAEHTGLPPKHKYPEHEKLSEVKERSQAIGEFLDGSGYTLCEVMYHADYNGLGGLSREPTRQDRHGHYVPVSKGIQKILADWFEIDQDKLETEKREMLARFRGESA